MPLETGTRIEVVDGAWPAGVHRSFAPAVSRVGVVALLANMTGLRVNTWLPASSGSAIC